MVNPGQPVPAFSLPDQGGVLVSDQSLRGRWAVVYFYPKDDTPGCTVEACEFTALAGRFQALDAEVLGCSADGAAAHQKFIQKHRLGIRLLTDADRSFMTACGAFGTKMMYGKQVEGVIRSTLLVAPDGSIAHRWATVKAAGHAAQVLAKLEELRGGAAVAAGGPPAVAKPAKAPAKQPTKKVVKQAAKQPTKKSAKKVAKKVAKKPARRR